VLHILQDRGEKVHGFDLTPNFERVISVAVAVLHLSARPDSSLRFPVIALSLALGRHLNQCKDPRSGLPQL
jgi:hypothetical protein